MGNPENTIFNLVMKFIFPLFQYHCVQMVHYMIHFHYNATFQVVPSLMILTLSENRTELIFTRKSAG